MGSHAVLHEVRVLMHRLRLLADVRVLVMQRCILRVPAACDQTGARRRVQHRGVVQQRRCPDSACEIILPTGTAVMTTWLGVYAGLAVCCSNVRLGSSRW